MSHIKYAVELKKQNLKVTLGIQMVLMPNLKMKYYRLQNWLSI